MRHLITEGEMMISQNSPQIAPLSATCANAPLGPIGADFQPGTVIATPRGFREVVGTTPPDPLFPEGVVLLQDGAAQVEQWAPGVLRRQCAWPDQRAFWCEDPRPELGESLLWETLLGLAWDEAAGESAGVFGALHGARCWGAGLEWTGRGWRIVPGAIEEAEWPTIKAELARHRETIRALVRQL